jgi:hypothetical protein
MKSACLKVWLLLACFLIAAPGWSQVKKISGKSTGTQTTVLGDFSIDATEGDVLVFSYAGYSPQEVTVGSASTVDIKLRSDAKMDEVVVIGYGTAKRSKVTSSVAKLDPKVLETGLRSNPAQALAGTIAGLRVSTGTGRPGSLPSIILRGGTNFDGSGSPLISEV